MAASLSRVVLPEALDELHPSDPRAHASRGDLRRVHRVMRSVSILKDALISARLGRVPRRILELGAGDATLLLRLAKTLHPAWPNVELTILDRHDLVSTRTREAYATLGWQIKILRQDALEWALQKASVRFDLCITTLFLHHFDGNALPTLMHAVSSCCDTLIACEPRRNRFARLGSALIGFLGANAVTRGDAVKSVDAGFNGQELSALWPNTPEHWSLREYFAPPFSHCFIAVRPHPGPVAKAP